MSMEVVIHVKPCPFPCEQCNHQGENFTVESIIHAWVLCQRCLSALIVQGNQTHQGYHFVLEYRLPLARYSEFPPGARVRYETAGQSQVGKILHIVDGGNGQLYIIENLAQGFPDVVPGRELFGE